MFLDLLAPSFALSQRQKVNPYFFAGLIRKKGQARLCLVSNPRQTGKK
jgi:hypothetical protein